MIIKYSAGHYSSQIRRVEVVKETEKTILIANGFRVYRTLKRSDYVSYFDTWEDARRALLKLREDRLRQLKTQMNRVEADILHIQEMTPPIE